MAVTRRELLGAIGAGWLLDAVLPDAPPITGRIVGADHRFGHALREARERGGPVSEEKAEVVVVGSGPSGASAAWRLAALGVEVLMLELEAFAGGTSAWGDDGVVAHPWGAHYLPVPERGARATRRLLEEMGVITGHDLAGRPVFREELLCHAPEERLFMGGKWHSGLVPTAVLGAEERREMERFHAIEEELSAAIGDDGRPAFALPLFESSRDPRFLELDRISMRRWLDEQGFATNFLRWYVQYATLDDFGADLDEASAWAGLHYFCARRFRTEQLEGSRFLVWPDGNGRLVQHLFARMHGERRHRQLVTAIASEPHGVRLEVLDASGPEPVLRRISARAAVLAVPAFIAERLVRLTSPLPRRPSSPWVVANLHVERPADPNGAWDSLIYDSPSLGYVDAGHQRMVPDDRTVLTYFRAYGAADVQATRAELLSLGWQRHAARVFADLAPAHPELPLQTSRLDVMLWGHAMPRPRPGFLSAAGAPLTAPVLLAPRIAWAHVDQTGIALFEEANAHGVRAAEALAPALGLDAGPTWT